MSKCNYIDFDDQILFACRILENNPDTLEKYQSRAMHLLVDEYQDINAAQFKLVEMLSRRCRNGLFAVGDDAQTIYSFRGSDPRFILRFSQDFPGAATPPLAHSYRCHEKIMNDSVKVLERYYNQRNRQQELEFHVPSGDEPAIWQLPSEISEAEMVARVAQHYIKQKKSVLVLVPKKEFFPLISRKLSAYNVPHECPINLLSGSVNKRIAMAKRLIDWVVNPSNSFITRLVFEDLINIGVAKVPGANKSRRCKPQTIQNRIAEEREIARLWESVDKRNDLFSVTVNNVRPNATIAKIRDNLLKLLECRNNFTRDKQGEF